MVLNLNKIETRTKTVVLDESDFGENDVPYVGLSVTVKIDFPISVRTTLSIFSSVGEISSVKESVKAINGGLDAMASIITDWSIVLDDAPYPINGKSLADLPESVFIAVSKAIQKALASAGSLDPK